MPFRLALYLMIVLGCDIPIIEAIDRCIYEAVQPFIRTIHNPYYQKWRLEFWSLGCTIQRYKKDYLSKKWFWYDDTFNCQITLINCWPKYDQK